MRVYGSPETRDGGNSGSSGNEVAPSSSSPSSSSSSLSPSNTYQGNIGVHPNNSGHALDEEYGVAGVGIIYSLPGVGDTTPLLSNEGVREGGKGNRKPRIISRPRGDDDRINAAPATSRSFKTAMVAGLVFIVTLMGLGYVYKSEENMGKGIHAVTAMHAHEERNAKQAVEASKTEQNPVAKDNLYDICRLNTHSRVKETCPHATTDFVVNGDGDGRWPRGFSWTVLKDISPGDMSDKSFLHSEKGTFDESKTNGKDIQCKRFVTQLCLTGNYIVYANSEDAVSAHSAVNVCNKKVAADEALDFSSDHVKCISSSFELDPDYSEFRNKKNKHDTKLQALSMSGGSGAPITSGAGGSMPVSDDAVGGVSTGAEGSMPPVEGGGSMPTGGSTPASDDSLSAGGNATIAGGSNDTVVGSNESVVDVNGTDPDAVPGNELPPTLRPSTTIEYFFPPPLVPSAAPTPVSSLAWDGSPPTIEQAWNYTSGNTTKVFQEDIPKTFTEGIPEKWDQTTKGFKYPTTAPTVPPSRADGSTAMPTTTGELFYPPTISTPLNQAYGNITEHDYAQDWNNTISGFLYPTAVPTVPPTVRPTLEGEVNKPDCIMFGMICDTPVSQQPSAEPTLAIDKVEHSPEILPGVPTPGAPAPAPGAGNDGKRASSSLRSRMSSSLFPASQIPSSGTWSTILHYIGLESSNDVEVVDKSVEVAPAVVIANADARAASQIEKSDDINSISGAKVAKLGQLATPSIGNIEGNPAGTTDMKKSVHHHAHGGTSGAAVAEVIDIVSEEAEEGMKKAAPIASKVAKGAVHKVQSTIAETGKEMKMKTSESTSPALKQMRIDGGSKRISKE